MLGAAKAGIGFVFLIPPFLFFVFSLLHRQKTGDTSIVHFFVLYPICFVNTPRVVSRCLISPSPLCLSWVGLQQQPVVLWSLGSLQSRA